MHKPFYMACALFGAWATTAAAQIMPHDDYAEPREQIIADINGDGIVDRLRITPHSETFDIFSIEQGYGADTPYFQFPDFVVPLYENRTGDPSINITSPTTFTLTTGCFACGRYHNWQHYHVAFRNGGFVLAGFTHSTVDRHFAALIECDVNLRAGRAEIRYNGDQDVQIYPIERVDIPLSDIYGGYGHPICEKTTKYDDDYLMRNSEN